ncbi:MAG: dihydroorotate dehydrogenase [candidate division WOR-3 bacterium]
MSWRVTIGRVEFASPVLTASGTWGFGLEFRAVSNRVAGIVTKGITLEPRAGNPPPRIWEFAGGIVNSVGLENPGVDEYIRTILPRQERLKCRVIVNIAGFSPEEYGQLAERLTQPRIDALEVNLSCPNVKEAGVMFGQSPKQVERITRLVRDATRKPVIVKLTANFVDPVVTAKAAADGGADAVTLINTLYALVLNPDGSRFLGGGSGGMSGPALKPFALFCVERVVSATGIPVIGSGGIMSGQDALDFMNAGACMVQVGSASLRNPSAPWQVQKELRRLLARSSSLRQRE